MAESEQKVSFTVHQAKRIVNAVRVVEGKQGPQGARNQHGQFFNPPSAFIVVTDKVRDGTNWRWDYTCKVLNAPFVDASEMAVDQSARNIFEIMNTDTNEMGYTVVTSDPECGDIIGITPVEPDAAMIFPATLWWDADESKYIWHFTWQNNFIIHQ
jgi:hypothetical protein